MEHKHIKIEVIFRLKKLERCPTHNMDVGIIEQICMTPTVLNMYNNLTDTYKRTITINQMVHSTVIDYYDNDTLETCLNNICEQLHEIDLSLSNR